MKDIITSREELLLAKIAGRDVNLETMTPPVASNMTEKLMLEIAERIDGIAGGGSDEPTYEVVAEIEVGEMTEQEGAYSIFVNESLPLDFSEKYYFNSGDYPLTYLPEATLAYNMASDGASKENPDEPLYVVGRFNEIGTVWVIGSDTDLSNTTVKILKKVGGSEGGGSELPEVTAADNGKILTVVNGVWDKADAPSGDSQGPEVIMSAEIETMSQISQDPPLFLTMLPATIPEVPEGASLYFNSTDYPLTIEDHGSDGITYSYNFDIETSVKDNPDEPGYVLQAINNAGFDAVSIISDSDLSGTTVNLLMQVEDEDGYAETFDVTGEFDAVNVTITNISATVAEISAAQDAGKIIRFTALISDGTCIPFDFRGVHDEPNMSIAVFFTNAVADTVNGVSNLYTLMIMSDGLRQQSYLSVVPTLPVTTSADAGKVLTVNEYGIPEWVTPT